MPHITVTDREHGAPVEHLESAIAEHALDAPGIGPVIDDRHVPVRPDRNRPRHEPHRQEQQRTPLAAQGWLCGVRNSGVSVQAHIALQGQHQGTTSEQRPDGNCMIRALPVVRVIVPKAAREKSAFGSRSAGCS